jgi:hypothetical protein
MRRLIDVFLPSRPDSPDALDTGGYDLIGARVGESRTRTFK